MNNIQKLSEDETAGVIGELINRYATANGKDESSNEYGLSRGILNEEYGTSIFIEIEDQTYALPRQSLNDVVGDELGDKIWYWIKP